MEISQTKVTIIDKLPHQNQNFRRRLKCRWCGLEFSAWFLADRGRAPVNGADALVEHVSLEHPLEYEDLQRKLDIALGEESKDEGINGLDVPGFVRP
jgi:hypothetical protein